jgi:diaminopimelate decarboxylase
MHIGSGSDLDHLVRVCDAMRAAARNVGPSLATISGGGGLPIPYRQDDTPLDVARYAAAWRDARDAIAAELGRAVRVEVEPGRFLVAEAGCVLTEVRAVKEVAGMPYVLVDAGFHVLCRPMMYGAFHAITLVGKDHLPRRPTMVAGPLCEAADVFTQDTSGAPMPQDLPVAEPGDLLCLHDTGAYGASMASNYNSMPVAPEVLIEGGVPRLVRPRQAHSGLMAAELALLGEVPR